jgi:hypothetical protein
MFEQADLQGHTVAPWTVALNEAGTVRRRYGIEVDGVIAPGELGLPMTFDFRAGLFALQRLPGFDADDGYTVPLTRDEEGPLRVDLVVNDGAKPISAVLDTALAANASLSRGAAKLLGVFTPNTPRLALVAPPGTPPPGSMQVRVGSLAVGNARMGRAVVTISETPGPARLGMGFLKRFLLTIDVGAGALRLEPQSAFTPVDPPVYGVGLTPASLHQGYWRVHVAERSPAAEAGIVPLDRLIAVNAENLEDASHGDVQRLLSPQPGTLVELELQRGAQRFRVTVTAVELL